MTGQFNRVDVTVLPMGWTNLDGFNDNQFTGIPINEAVAAADPIFFRRRWSGQ